MFCEHLKKKLFHQIIKQFLICRLYLLIDANDEYDQEFIRMKEEGQISKMARMVEDLEKAKSYVEECKRLLADKKRQVVYQNIYYFFFLHFSYNLSI